MRKAVLIGVFVALAAPAAWAQTRAPDAGEMRELVEAAKATAKAAREGADSAQVVPDILTQVLAKLDKLEADPSIEKCAEIMSDLFGENPTRVVIEDFQKRFADKAHRGGLFALGGSGGLALGSSGLAAKPLTETAYPIRRHTDFGSNE